MHYYTFRRKYDSIHYSVLMMTNVLLICSPISPTASPTSPLSATNLFSVFKSLSFGGHLGGSVGWASNSWFLHSLGLSSFLAAFCFLAFQKVTETILHLISQFYRNKESPPVLIKSFHSVFLMLWHRGPGGPFLPRIANSWRYEMAEL